MFFFGPLSTHLPYIIIGLLYVVSISVFSFRALAAEPYEDIYAEPDTREVESDQKLVVSTASFEDFCSYPGQFVATEAQTRQSTYLCGTPHLLFFTRPPCLLSPVLLPFLSRPPPAMV